MNIFFSLALLLSSLALSAHGDGHCHNERHPLQEQVAEKAACPENESCNDCAQKIYDEFEEAMKSIEKSISYWKKYSSETKEQCRQGREDFCNFDTNYDNTIYYAFALIPVGRTLVETKIQQSGADEEVKAALIFKVSKITSEIQEKLKKSKSKGLKLFL
ncbi:MAG TPA: hypothetical protein VEK38_00500 [Candidatus Bathyarchaeia archaeon]|nr:hypothetical protein [Candidatus Bathyarchaeia archaeon]